MQKFKGKILDQQQLRRLWITSFFCKRLVSAVCCYCSNCNSIVVGCHVKLYWVIINVIIYGFHFDSRRFSIREFSCIKLYAHICIITIINNKQVNITACSRWMHHLLMMLGSEKVREDWCRFMLSKI